MSLKWGIRCLKCNTDAWMSPISVKYCKCKNTSISLDGVYPTFGRRDKTPYLILRDEDGTIKEIEPMDTTRAPKPELDETHAKKKIITPEDF